jgi:formylglycine-generating enzyme required for sulfatase activity
MFYRTFSNTGGGATGELDPATISSFRLDKYDVTVGRFRQFVNAWNDGWRPAAASGKHSHLNGGEGLANASNQGTFEPGWVTTDDANISLTSANLASCTDEYNGNELPESTWTASAGTQENLPMNCVNSYEAYAFCIWDGGFPPSQAEMLYAASGGSQQLEYPWGSAAPGFGNEYAIYGCIYQPEEENNCYGVGNIAPVGTTVSGAGVWGQLDLAGEVAMWNVDWEPTTGDGEADPCTDCGAFSQASGERWAQLTAFVSPGSSLVNPGTGIGPPAQASFYNGIRCARAP